MGPRNDWDKYKKPIEDESKTFPSDKQQQPLSEDDIQVLKTYGKAPYMDSLKDLEDDITNIQKNIIKISGVKESDTGLAPQHLWDIMGDSKRLQEEHPLQVARCTKIIKDKKNKNTAVGGLADAVQQAIAGGLLANEDNENSESNTDNNNNNAGAEEDGVEGGDEDDIEYKYIINMKQIAKYVVALGEKLSPTDVEEGMRVGVDRQKYHIELPLPPRIDPTVTMMTVEEKPDITYNDVGGCKEQIEKLKEVVELPLLQPERFAKLGIDPPKGILLYGPPGTGKTLCARAVANRTDATFIRVIGSELVQKYVGEGARMVRELFEMARTKKACIIFFDEIDAIGGARFDDGEGGDNEVQRTMLELITQLDGFDPRGNIKVMFATNRPNTLDPALLRPGRIDRKVEFSLPDLEGRANIFKIHARSMSVERKIRWELISRLCPNTTGAELRSVCTEAGMFAIRARRKVATEKDFLQAVEKVINGYKKFSSTSRYMQYN